MTLHSTIEVQKQYIQCVVCKDLVWNMATVITRHGDVCKKCYDDGSYGNLLMLMECLA